MDELAQIRWGRAVGFTIAELRILREGLNSGRAPSEVWKDLAERKLEEVRAAIRAARRMERTLAEGLRCTCRALAECRLHCEEGER
jgi:DNA-binding transcriptional MerR regulator